MYQTTFYRESSKFRFTEVCLRVKIYRIKKESKENVCLLLDSIQRPLSYKAYALTTVLPMYMSVFTYASVTIQSVIYLFNIYSRHIDGYR